jgi:hypothetical protein
LIICFSNVFRLSYFVPRIAFALLAACLAVSGAVLTGTSADDEDANRVRKVVLIAGPLDKGHPPGTHEYEKAARLIKHCLDTSPNVRGLRSELHPGGWPDDPATLDDADTIVLIASGSDRRLEDHPLLVEGRLVRVERQMKRGCGLVVIHWATFAPKDTLGDKFLDWIGGYFDYETGSPPRRWFSKIQTATTKPHPATPRHPICLGLAPFELREEYYYNIRFRERDPRLVPILSTPIPGEPNEQVVAWAVERSNGGRGFGFTGGHFFDNWGVDGGPRFAGASGTTRRARAATTPTAASASKSPRPITRSHRECTRSRPQTSCIFASRAKSRSRCWPRHARRSLARTNPWRSCTSTAKGASFKPCWVTTPPRCVCRVRQS